MTTLDKFVKISLSLIESKVHGLPSKSTLTYVKNNPVEAIEQFFDKYTTTAERFKRRDPSLISGTFWMRPKHEREEIWKSLEACRDLALTYQMEK